MTRTFLTAAAAVATLLIARPSSSAPTGYWCFLIGGDRDNSVCAKQHDQCEKGQGITRQLGSSPGDCTRYDSVWSTHYKMGNLDNDWFYVTKDQCEAMRELFTGTVCKEKR